MDFPRIVKVAFVLPGFGRHVEVYDILNPNDRACWHVNSGSYPQISVEIATTATIPDDRPRRIAAWHRLVRMRGKKGKKLGLALRTSQS